MQSQPWAEKWIKGEVLDRGGQGCAFKAQRISSTSEDAKYVLKLLHRKDDPERRSRMKKEVSSLRKLDHPLIAKYVDSNVDNCPDDTPLYLVTELIPGPTLQRAGEDTGPFDAEKVAKMGLKLLDGLEYCQKQGVLHRDFKPDNIILRDNDPYSPVILDFGLSFNDEPSDETLETESGQHMGNRFLRLPEHQMHGQKRDPRSDVAQLVGILFFALTKLYPDTPLDGDNLKPHQRERAKPLLDRLSPTHRELFVRIFDVGFSLAMLERWQSPTLLRKALEDGIKPSPARPSFSSRLQALKKSVLETPDVVIKQRIEKIQETCMNACSKLVHTANNELRDIGDVGSGSAPVAPGCVPVLGVSFQSRFKPNRLSFGYLLSIKEGIVTLVISLNNQISALCSVGLFDSAAEKIICDAIEESFAETFKRHMT